MADFSGVLAANGFEAPPVFLNDASRAGRLPEPSRDPFDHRLIAALRARGAVDAGVDPGLAGRIVFNNLNQEFAGFVRDDAMTLPDLRARVGAQTRLLAAMMRQGADASAEPAA